MSKINSHQLDRILNNNISGSSEIVQLLNDYFLSIRNNKSEIKKSIRSSKSKLNQFEEVNSYLNQLKTKLKTEKELLKFLSTYSQQQKNKIERIFRDIYPQLKKFARVITISKSGTVTEVLKLWFNKNKNLRVVVCESRPNLEGRLMAESLAKIGIKTELISDAMMSLYVPKVDAAIVGADLILNNGNLVNKVGSKSIALLCKEYMKPFFVVTTKSKFSRNNKFKLKEEDPKEISRIKVKNLTGSNIYFEEIEKKFITKIFTV